MSQVFVSYKRTDKDKVFPLVQKMESELGVKFWVDLEGIDGDSQFTSVIIDAINECEVFLFMYSKAHEKIVDFEYDFTVRELNFAHIRRKRIIFIDIEDTNLPDWFIFNFPQRQVTQAGDNRAMGKLVGDIRKWLRPTQQNSSPNSVGLTTNTEDIQTRGEDLLSASLDANKPHPQIVDLGLLSGTRWASCNVGAARPEECGGYFAWGEIEEKKSYSWNNYIHCEGTEDTCHNLVSDIAGTKYDVAHTRWGSSWRMPTIEQIKELLDNCTSEWMELNGVKGVKFISKANGNCIFMPAAGSRWDVPDSVGIYGHYWSSTQCQANSDYVYYLHFGMWAPNSYCSNSRSRGRSVRPVRRF